MASNLVINNQRRPDLDKFFAFRKWGSSGGGGRFILALLITSCVCWGQWVPTAVMRYSVPNITSSATIIDNRSQFIATADYHTCIVSASGSWSVQLQYSDGTAGGPWHSFPESSSFITDASVPPTCQATGYHPFLRFTTTGTVSITYAGSKGYYPGGSGSSSGGAPVAATYILQTANGLLPNAQVLGSLATGILKNTNVTGVLSIAAGSDLPTGIPVASIDSGSITSAQFNRLSGVTSNIQTQLDAKAVASGTHTNGKCLEWNASGFVVTAASNLPCAPSATPAGSGTEFQFRNSSAFGADATIFYVGQVSTPAAPAVSNQGTPGATSYSYKVVAHNGVGTTPASAATATATGNATLDGTNYNAVVTVVSTGVLYYDIYRTASAGTPSTTGRIATLVTPGATFNDIGIAGDGVTAPSANTTVGVQAVGFTNGTSQVIFEAGTTAYINNGQINLRGQFIGQYSLVPAFISRSSGANYGQFGNDSSTSWYLGYGTDPKVNGTAALKWNTSGLVTIPGSLSVASLSGVGLYTAGALSVVSGTSTNCVHVDGTSATCATGTVSPLEYLRGNEDTGAIEAAAFPFYIAASYNFTPQAPGGTIAIGGNTKTLTPCPLGVAGADANHNLYISGGTGTAEAVTITGGTCTSGAASGTIIFVAANTHSGAYTIGSASGGIHEAVFALPSGGGEVRVGRGTINMRARTWIAKANVTIRGEGRATILKRTNSSGAIFLNTAASIWVKDLLIDGNFLSTSSYELEVGSNGGGADGVWIINNQYSAMEVVGNDITIQNCTLIGQASATDGGIGIWHGGCPGSCNNNTKIINNTIKDQTVNATYGSGTNILISGNYFTGNHVQIFPTPGGQILVADDAANENILIENNMIGAGGGTGTSGIEADSRNERIVGNTIELNNWGIVIQTGAHVDIIGNTIKNNTAAGVQVSPGISQWTLIGNRITDDQGVATQLYGLHIDAGATDNYIVTHNDFRGNVTLGFSNGATGANRVIEGNLPAVSNAVAFANLGAADDGTVLYCSNCTIANPCAGASTGAQAKKLNGVWVCN